MSSASATDRIAVRTGSLSGTVIDGTLREVRVNGGLALDAVYAAVRDTSWGTVPGTFTAYDVTLSIDTFLVSFTCRHDDVFEWRGRISGTDGTITFELDGTALRSFSANRIGVCLLHPIDLAGHPAVARTGSGESDSQFPVWIAPHQPFLDLRGLRYLVTDGDWLDVTFEGEVFETEDHRNWTDSGWKTYCPPLDRSYPVTYRPGDRVRQAVTLAVHSASLPQLGLGAAAGRPSDTALSALRAVRPSHLHVDLSLAGDWQGQLDNAAWQASALDATLDVAIETDGRGWDEWAGALARHRVGRVAVFEAMTQVTPLGLADGLRTALRERGSEAQVGGGSNAWFAELNRARVPLHELEFVTYGISPQLHHFDDDSVMDTLRAQTETVRNARRIAGGLPITIGSVRLHPHQPDARQRAGFLAAWTVGSVLALAEGGAEAITYFQTSGDEGIVGPESPYPVHRVFAALAGRTGQQVRRVETSSRPVACFEVGDVTIVANLRGAETTVTLPAWSGRLAPYAVEVLDA